MNEISTERLREMDKNLSRSPTADAMMPVLIVQNVVQDCLAVRRELAEARAALERQAPVIEAARIWREVHSENPQAPSVRQAYGAPSLALMHAVDALPPPSPTESTK